MVYNMNGALDRGATSEVIKAVNPDVLCAIEVPARFGLARLARRCDLDVAARAGRRRLGVAVLVGPRVRVLSHSASQLRDLSGLPRRAAAQAILSAEGGRFAVLTAQLGLRPEAREQRAEDLLELLGKLSVPGIVGLDLNEGPGGRAGRVLCPPLVDAFAVAGDGPGHTYPNPEPTLRKDHVLVDAAFAPVRAWVPGAAPVGIASHHRPLVVELQLQGAADQESVA